MYIHEVNDFPEQEFSDSLTSRNYDYWRNDTGTDPTEWLQWNITMCSSLQQCVYDSYLKQIYMIKTYASMAYT